MSVPDDRVLLLQLERRVEDAEEKYKELTTEVDHLDIFPDCNCDCGAYNLATMEADIGSLQEVIATMLTTQEMLINRLQAIEAGLQ